MKRYLAGDIVPFQTVLELDPDADDSVLYVQSNHVSEVIGESTALYETYVRKTTREPFRFAGYCERLCTVNLEAACARRIFISSSYRKNPELGAEIAKAACALWTGRGYLPIAPHIYFPQFMGEEPRSRDYGINAGLCALARCQEIAVYMVDGAISEGMKEEIHAAISSGMNPKYYNISQEAVPEFIVTGRGAVRERK